MPDNSSLQMIGVVMAGLTASVMVVAAVLVYRTATGGPVDYRAAPALQTSISKPVIAGYSVPAT